MSITGTIVEYKRFAVHDGDGIRTTLFLKGCPLSCHWCHNPEGISYRPQTAYLPHKCISCGECNICPGGAHTFDVGKHGFDRKKCTACGKCVDVCLGEALILYGRRVTAEDAVDTLLLDRDFFLSSGGGVTLSGGEPLIQPEFTAEVFRLVKEQGISTALDTCGYAPRKALETVLPYTDKVLFDMKVASSTIHERYTSKPNELIRENLRYINEVGIPVEIRIPLVPTVNDGEIEDIAKILSPLKVITAVRVLAYHGYAETKYESLGLTYKGAHFEPPTKEQLSLACKILKDHGLNVILSE